MKVAILPWSIFCYWAHTQPFQPGSPHTDSQGTLRPSVGSHSPMDQCFSNLSTHQNHLHYSLTQECWVLTFRVADSGRVRWA